MPEGDNLTWHDTVAASDLEDSTPKEFRLGDRLLALVLRTGKVLDPPAETDLKTYPVRLSGNVVQVGLPLAKG
jgi:nitrite reductase/ring-hydroxylating ferredoxin subunit